MSCVENGQNRAAMLRVFSRLCNLMYWYRSTLDRLAAYIAFLQSTYYYTISAQLSDILDSNRQQQACQIADEIMEAGLQLILKHGQMKSFPNSNPLFINPLFILY